MAESTDAGKSTVTQQRAVNPPQDSSALNFGRLSPAPFEIMRMQSVIGNHATRRLLQGHLQRVPITDPAQLKAARIKHQAAQLNNVKDAAALVKAVEDGIKLRNTDRRLANSCEWVKVGKAKLYAATSTEDSDDRIAEDGMNPAADLALFPNGLTKGDDHIFGAKKPAYKFDDLADNTGVDLDEDGKVTNGWNVPGAIAIYNARNVPVEEVWSTLRHEVQHDSDHSDDKTTAAGSTMEENFEGFKTEYRAYNYQQTGYENLSTTTVVNKYGYAWKERQLAIFEQIHGGYEHTQQFWDDSDPGDDTLSTKGTPNDDTISALAKTAIEARQARLVAYTNPDTEGFNKWNSVRVEDFYVALKAVPASTASAADPTIVELLKKANPLKLEDKRYIRAESPDWETMLTAKLAGAAKTAVYTKLGKT